MSFCVNRSGTHCLTAEGWDEINACLRRMWANKCRDEHPGEEFWPREVVEKFVNMSRNLFREHYPPPAYTGDADAAHGDRGLVELWVFGSGEVFAIEWEPRILIQLDVVVEPLPFEPACARVMGGDEAKRVLEEIRTFEAVTESMEANSAS